MSKKRTSAEDRWVRVYGCDRRWAVRVEAGMKLKDLPADIRIATEPHEGAFEPLRFRAGVFLHVEWAKADPLAWPEAEETPIGVGDYLIEDPDGGVSFRQSNGRRPGLSVVDAI